MKTVMKRLSLIILAAVILLAQYPAVYASAADENQPDGIRSGEAAFSLEPEVDASGEQVTVPDGFRPDAASDGSSSVAAASSGSKGLSGGTISGTSLKWVLYSGKLVINGNGKMCDFSGSERAPWYDKKDEITSVDIKNGVTSIGAAAFYQMDKITSVSLPSSLRRIESGAFADCYALTSLTIPEGVTYLGDYFIQRTGIESITVPASVTEICSLALGFSDLKSIVVTSGNTKYKSADGILYTKDGKTLLTYPTQKTNSSFTVPNGVTTIGYGAFIKAENLKSINTNKVSTIEEWAFSDSGLTSFTFTNTITNIKDGIFSDCQSLTEVQFGKGIKDIPYQTCYKCYNLKKVGFGTARTIDNLAFAYTAIESLDLPATMKELSVGSFAECDSLKSVRARGLIHVAYQAFYGDDQLTSVILNEGIGTIYAAAFYQCYGLTKVTIPASCTWVHEHAFPASTKLINKNSKMVAYGRNGYMDTLTINGKLRYDYAYKVLDLVNTERSKAGLSKLKMDKILLDDAALRAAELTVLFSHCRPNGSSVVGDSGWFGYTPGLNNVQGENIAYGQSSPKDVMKSWMNSQGHKENILSADWTAIGVGCFEYNGRLYWVQTFSTQTENTDFAKPSNRTAAMPIHIEENSFEDSTQNYEKVKFDFSIAGKSAVLKDRTIKLTLKLGDVKFNGDSVVWKTGDRSIATVDKTGKVKGLKAGKVKITAYSRGYKRASKTITVNVIDKQTAKITDKVITARKNDKDIKGSSFCRLKPQVKKTGKSSVTLSWTKIDGSDGYEIYGTRCNTGGKVYKFQKLKTLKSGKKSWTQKNLNKGTCYKYIILAYMNVDGKKKTLSVSPVLHTSTKGGKYTADKSVKITRIGKNKSKTSTVTLSKGKKVRIYAKEVKGDKSLKLMKHRGIRYESTDKTVATVSSKGLIKAVGKGKCTIYVYTQNGKKKTIKVTVK